MLQYEVLKHELNEKQAALDELKDALGLERLREEVEMLGQRRRSRKLLRQHGICTEDFAREDCCVKAEGPTYLNLVSPLEYADAH